MTRSVSASCSAKTPAWRSIASTRVVFPWSTWAMIATLRMSERWGTRCPNASYPSVVRAAAAVTAAAARALDVQRHPAAIRALDGGLDALHPDVEGAEPGDPLEGRVARDFDADGAALRVMEPERPLRLADADDRPSYCVAAEAVATPIDMVSARAVMR